MRVMIHTEYISGDKDASLCSRKVGGMGLVGLFAVCYACLYVHACMYLCLYSPTPQHVCRSQRTSYPSTLRVPGFLLRSSGSVAKAFTH